MPITTEIESDDLLQSARQKQQMGLLQQDANLLLNASGYYKQAGNNKEAADMACIAALMYARRGKYKQAIPIILMYADYFSRQSGLLQQITSLFPNKSLPTHVQKHLQAVKQATPPALPASFTALLAQEDAQIRQKFIDSLTYKTLPSKTLWEKAGVYNPSLSIVIEGCLRAFLEIGGMQKIMGEFKAGDICGEQAYYLRKAGIVHIRAIKTSVIAKCSFEDLERFLPKLPYLQTYLQKLYATGLRFNQLLLAPSLSQLPIDDIQILAANMQEYHCQAGKALCTQGENVDYVYVLRTGRIVLTSNIKGRDMIIATLSSGALLGDEAIASKDGIAKTNAYSINNCVLWRMQTSSMQWCYQTSNHIKRLLDWRLVTQNKNLKSLQEVVDMQKDHATILRNEIWDA